MKYNLPSSVFTLPAWRRFCHGKFVFNFFLLGIIVDLIQSLGSGVLSPLDPVGFTEINNILENI